MFYGNLGGYIHNAGTWFISCFVLAYFMFPYLHNLFGMMKRSSRTKVLILMCAMTMYIPIATTVVGANREYPNPLFRLLEFCVGMLLAKFKAEGEKGKKRLLLSCAYLCLYLVLIVGVSFLYKCNYFRDNWISYNILVVPVFSAIIYFADCIEWNLRLCQKFSIISYDFFFVQYFTWAIMGNLMESYQVRRSIIVISSLTINCVLSVAFHLCWKRLSVAISWVENRRRSIK